MAESGLDYCLLTAAGYLYMLVSDGDFIPKHMFRITSWDATSLRISLAFENYLAQTDREDNDGPISALILPGIYNLDEADV